MTSLAETPRPMRVISHRGFWLEPVEKNALTAFERSFSLGFGTETDVRDHGGSLVISHDMPRGDEIALTKVLDLYRAYGCNGTLALNIKADGLQTALADTMKAYSDICYYTFDMSLPDTLGYARRQLPFYLRLSEYETELPPIQGCSGIWLDAFHGHWYSPQRLASILDKHEVCIVSAELHHRSHLAHWRWIQATGLASHPRLSLCTDFPVKASEFFNAPT